MKSRDMWFLYHLASAIVNSQSNTERAYKELDSASALIDEAELEEEIIETQAKIIKKSLHKLRENKQES